MIKIKNLTKQFMSLKAVDNLTVNIPANVTTGLIGPNGSGKTTLMNVLTGVLRPEAGEIVFNGKSYDRIKKRELRALKIARTFQDGRLIEQMSVWDNILLAIAENNEFKSIFEVKADKYQKRMIEVLELTGLRPHKNKNAGDLSYGQRKLLEIARVLIEDADIIFFDEPFTGLFPEVVEQVVDIIKELKKQNKTIVIIEHNMGLIQRLCDNTIVLDYGKLMATGKPEEVLQNKKVQEAYLGV